MNDKRKMKRSLGGGPEDARGSHVRVRVGDRLLRVVRKGREQPSETRMTIRVSTELAEKLEIIHALSRVPRPALVRACLRAGLITLSGMTREQIVAWLERHG